LEIWRGYVGGVWGLNSPLGGFSPRKPPCPRPCCWRSTLNGVTSQGHVTSSVTSPFDSPWAPSYRLPLGRNPVSLIVVEIFSLKWLYNTITDLTTPGSTNRLEGMGALHSRCLC